MKTPNLHIKINLFFIIVRLLIGSFCADSDCPDSVVSVLKCSKCDEKCQNQVQQKCAPGDDICFDFRYKDETIEKGCMKEADYESVREKKNKNHDGLREDSYKCKGNLCNNQINDGLRCYQCKNDDCDNPVEAKCLPEQTLCYHFVWDDGTSSKGCMEKEKLLKKYKNERSHLDDFSYDCSKYLCNDLKLEDYSQAKYRQVCSYCTGKCEEVKDMICPEEKEECYSFYYKDGTVHKSCVMSDYRIMHYQANRRNGGLQNYSFKCDTKRCNI